MKDEIIDSVVNKNIPMRFWKNDTYYKVATGVVAVVGFVGEGLCYTDKEMEFIKDRQIYLYLRQPFNDLDQLTPLN